MSRSARWLVLILAVAALHAAFYIVHERPEWSVSWTDQGGYRLLAEGLRQSGRFTRYPDVTPLVPEPLRTPGYPIFVAAVFSLFGSHQLPVVLAQAALFVVLCAVVYRLARWCASEETALVAAAITAVYSPLPYFSALLLTELWTTFVLTIALLFVLRAMTCESRGSAAIAGFLLGYAALSRPVFVLLPFGLLAAAVVVAPRRQRQVASEWALVVVVFAITMAPWFAYNQRYFGHLTISGSGVGRPVFEGTWQGVWPGRVEAQLTNLAGQPTSDAQLDADVSRLAADTGRDAEPMLRYVRQWRDVRKIWEPPQEPRARAEARVRGEQEYLRLGLENIRRSPWEYLARRVVRGVPVLWVADIPLRQTIVPTLPGWVIRLMWVPQALVAALALVGAAVLWQARRLGALVTLAAPVLYVTAVHFFFLTEARQSLPVKPAVIVLAAVGVTAARSRSRAVALAPATVC